MITVLEATSGLGGVPPAGRIDQCPVDLGQRSPAVVLKPRPDRLVMAANRSRGGSTYGRKVSGMVVSSRTLRSVTQSQADALMPAADGWTNYSSDLTTNSDSMAVGHLYSST